MTAAWSRTPFPQGGCVGPGFATAHSHPCPSLLQCMWWKTKDEMTWAHPPASRPAGLLSVAAAFGICSPDQLSPPALPALPPPPIGVLPLTLLIAVMND